MKNKFQNTSTRQAEAVFEVLWNMGCDICMEFPIIVWDGDRGQERTFYADIWFFEVCVDIEIDGWQHTSDSNQLQQDADRHRLLAEIFIPVLRFTNDEVNADPKKVAHTIYHLLHYLPGTPEADRLFWKEEYERRHANPYPCSEYVL